MTHKIMRKRFRFKKNLLLVGAGVLLFLLLLLAFLLQPAYSASTETLTFVKDAVIQQQKIEEGLRAYYQAGNYTFSEPLVIQNPYQTAPLTALLIFDTPENSQISIQIPGETPLAAVDFTFAGYQQHHEIPVYGLYANALNRITVSMKTPDGESEQTEVDLQTEPLPVFMQNFQIDKANPDKYNPGFNFAFMDLKPVFDIDGNVRWYSTEPSWWVFSRLQNGRFLFTYSVGEQDGNIMMEQDLLGKIYAIYNIADGIHHDVYELPTGNLLVTSSDLKSDTVEDYIFEVDRGGGHIVRSFDLKKYLDEYRPRAIGLASNDWLHLNSIVYDTTDNTIIITSKAQSAVIKMTYPGMQIKWILGSHYNWSAKYQPYLLTPLGEEFEWPWLQHHATLYGLNSQEDNTVDILMFDNGLYHSFDLANAYSPQEWYSRLVHYRIDEASMTVEQVWEYGREGGVGIYSLNQSGAYLLPNGNVLGTWSAIAKDAQGNPVTKIGINDTYETKIIEVDPSSNEVVFECIVPEASTYRTLRAEFYDVNLEENVYLSTSLKDTSANDLVDRSVMAWRDVKRWINTVPLLLSLKRLVRRILAALR
jgi:arylsulfate sulfotransferase